uniref:Si:dkey-234h16.7 n=1 Tax=Echeneis naucrates TaxID=173247 RepID=A0A665UQA1_ECHNA
MKPHLVPHVLLLCCGVLVCGRSEDSGLTERAYVVLEKQNLVLLGSVLAVLLLLMIIMAVCVYKPLSRR